eukprot:1323328-Rhodomonas_salina.1
MAVGDCRVLSSGTGTDSGELVPEHQFELFNYYSPVVAVPHVVEVSRFKPPTTEQRVLVLFGCYQVTLSTAAGSGEAQYLGDPDPYSAPHRGFNVQVCAALGSRVQGRESRVQGPGSRVQGPGSR